MKRQTFAKLMICMSVIGVFILYIVKYGFMIGSLCSIVLIGIGFLMLKLFEFIDTKLKD